MKTVLYPYVHAVHVSLESFRPNAGPVFSLHGRTNRKEAEAESAFLSLGQPGNIVIGGRPIIGNGPWCRRVMLPALTCCARIDRGLKPIPRP